MRIKNKLFSRKLILGIALGFAIESIPGSQFVSAQEFGQWPPHLLMTTVMFTPYFTTRFVDTQGLARYNYTSEHLDKYFMRSPKGPWKTPQSCNQPERPPGYIHTNKDINSLEPYWGKIGVPISMELNTSFSGLKKEQLLNSTLLSVRVFALDGDDGDDVHPGLSQDEIEAHEETGSYELVQLHKFDFTIRQLCELQEDCQRALRQPHFPVHLTLNQPVVTEPFLIANGKLPYEVDPLTGKLDMVNRGKIRIRVEWSFNGICDEDEFKFKVADQIRIMTHLPKK